MIRHHALRLAVLWLVVHGCTAPAASRPESWLEGRLNDRPWIGLGKTHLYEDGVVLVGGYRGGDDYCRSSPDCESITVVVPPDHPALRGGEGDVHGELVNIYDGVVRSSFELMGTLSTSSVLTTGSPWEGELELRSVQPGTPMVFRQGRFKTIPMAMDRPYIKG